MINWYLVSDPKKPGSMSIALTHKAKRKSKRFGVTWCSRTSSAVQQDPSSRQMPSGDSKT